MIVELYHPKEINNDMLIRLINEYHEKVEHYKAIEADYHRLKTLESRVETITVQKTIPSHDLMDGYITETVWRGVVSEMASNIAQMLGEGKGLHVQQDFVSNRFGGMELGLILTTQFKFIKTMGKNKF